MTIIQKALNSCKTGVQGVIETLKARVPSEHSDEKVATVAIGFFSSTAAVAGLAVVKGFFTLGVGSSVGGLAALILYTGHQLYLRNQKTVRM